MYPFAKVSIVVGIFLVGLGIILMLLSKISVLERLPGDIVIEKKNIIIILPITTALLISVILTLVLNYWLRK